jgi:hypothetical protein
MAMLCFLVAIPLSSLRAIDHFGAYSPNRQAAVKWKSLPAKMRQQDPFAVRRVRQSPCQAVDARLNCRAVRELLKGTSAQRCRW